MLYAACLDSFISPVHMTNCGDNYCQQCLTVMAGPYPWICPECINQQHQEPEQLARNYFLEEGVQNFIETKTNICAFHNLQKKLRKSL